MHTLDYAEHTLGYGARGLPAMGTNDYADGILLLASEPTTPTGTSSTFDACFAILGLPLAADVLEARDAALAGRMRDIVTAQTALMESEAWDGTRYHRGFVDSGNPLAPDYLFLEPQVLPILGGLVSDARRDALLDLVERQLETPLGALTTIAYDGSHGSATQPQIGGVWPVASAWVTEAWSRRDPMRGWESLGRNTLFTHATLYPDLWYGVWTGPDSYDGPAADRPGEADVSAVTAHSDWPAMNVHAHLGPLRALLGLLGVRPTAAGLDVVPRVPTATYAVHMPRLSIDSAPDRMRVRYTPLADDAITLRVAVPFGTSPIPSVTIDGVAVTPTLDAGLVVVPAAVHAGATLDVVITRG